MRRSGAWSIGVVTSVVLHGASAALLLVIFDSRPVVQQPAGKARVEMVTQSVPAQSANEAAPSVKPASEGRLASTNADKAEIPVSQATENQIETPRSEQIATSGIQAIATKFTKIVLNARAPIPESLNTTPLATQAASLAETQATALRPQQPVAKASLPVPPPTNRQTNLSLPMETADPGTPNSAELTDAQLNTTVLPGQPANGADTPEGVPANETAAELVPESVITSAMLAWSGDLSLEVRDDTIEAAVALRVQDRPPEKQALRDELAQRLADVKCARVQANYDPNSGALALRGHVKTDKDRDTLVAALEQQLDGAIPVIDGLRRLGAPQCEALAVLSEMPMAQSVEQFINPLIIGEDLHTRVYDFADGEPMRFDLSGADYDAWFYLDYFDSNGQVLHLVPNDFIAPFVLGANQPVVFGGGGVNDITSGLFEMRVSPPYGQDIAVAMVANTPLFDATRENIEPAKPYLIRLSQRVREMRDASDDFKGEWVYIFIETRAPG
jgi:hypothetical protein